MRYNLGGTVPGVKAVHGPLLAEYCQPVIELLQVLTGVVKYTKAEEFMGVADRPVGAGGVGGYVVA